jgi:hypothetical protein
MMVLADTFGDLVPIFYFIDHSIILCVPLRLSKLSFHWSEMIHVFMQARTERRADNKSIKRQGTKDLPGFRFFHNLRR